MGGCRYCEPPGLHNGLFLIHHVTHYPFYAELDAAQLPALRRDTDDLPFLRVGAGGGHYPPVDDEPVLSWKLGIMNSEFGI